MKMLKLLGLTVFVVCIAAFASGCGGGGGGSAQMPDTTPPVVEPEPPVVEPDPEPTDAERIAAARRLLVDIVAGARNLALTASSVAAAVEVHPDATAEQIDNALVNAVAAQTALADVLAASSAGNAAATPAAAESAVADAQAALDELSAAQSAVASIQSAVEAVASQRQQQVADEAALTNNSSLIQLVRANKLLSDALLTDLEAGRLNVGPAGNATPSSEGTAVCTAPCAQYRADIGTGADRATGQRTVVVQLPASNSKTPTLSGPGRFPYGFDLKNADETTFVNAYTDIAQEGRVRKSDATVVDDPATDHDERYDYKPDTDYLLAGIWLTVPADLSNSEIHAFAYGGQPTGSGSSNFCGSSETGESGTGTTSVTTRVCETTTGFHTISTFVKDGEDFTATYTGDANGAYIAGGDTSYFTGSVTLTAEFNNPTGAAVVGEGSIEGAVTNIVAGGQSMEGSIELQKQTFLDDISGNDKFAAGVTAGVVDGKSFSGSWKGQFFGMTRFTRTQTTVTATDTSDPPVTTRTITTTYSPQAPGSVAGTFYVKQLSNPAGEAAFIGAFGAHR